MKFTPPAGIIYLGFALVVTGQALAQLEPIAPVEAPFPVPQFSRPAIPDLAFSIVDFGAIPGGSATNTQAIARAIVACTEAGGGRVVVPEGIWLTGAIHLQSNVELHLEQGAILRFSDNPEDYLPVVFTRVGGVELYNYSSLIYARDAENIAITGPGKLDGQGLSWAAWKEKETNEAFRLAAAGVPAEERVFGTPEAAIRPSFINFVNCRTILLEGFTIGSGPNWTIHPIYSDNIIIRRVTVDTWGPNNDGIDVDSCRNVLIEHCRFNTEDDCVVLKSGYNEDGRRVARPTENVIMRHCTSNRGHGGLVIGSEMSGDVRNVFMRDCTFDGTDRAVRIKSRRDRGGVVENIFIEDLVVKDMQREVILLNMAYTADRSSVQRVDPPVFRNIQIRRVVALGAPEAIRIRGLEDSPIEDLVLEDMVIRSERGIFMEHARNVEMRNVTVVTDVEPELSADRISGLEITEGRLRPDSDNDSDSDL
jgi:polygalacturonase